MIITTTIPINITTNIGHTAKWQSIRLKKMEKLKNIFFTIYILPVSKEKI